MTKRGIAPHSNSLPRRGERANRSIFFGFEENGLNVRRDGVLTIRQGIEITVGAFADAERNVDVKTFQLIPPNQTDELVIYPTKKWSVD